MILLYLTVLLGFSGILAQDKPIHDIDCYTGNGLTYRGKESKRADGNGCVSWTDSDIIAPAAQLNFLRSKLIEQEGTADMSLCRNPDGSESAPWCFTRAEPGWGLCGVPKCADACTSKPCQHGSTCRAFTKFWGYMCKCTPGYEGVNCETDINECASLPCQFGGTCIDKVNDFQCQCRTGYKGKFCEIEENECASAPCLNGGTCRDEVNNFRCDCTPGFRGRICEIVDGGWSSWQSWTLCTKTCGRTGTRTRNRLCSNPPPSNGGNDCIGNTKEVEACPNIPCPDPRINGQWSPWTDWSRCTKSCGLQGQRQRSRICNNPPPSNGGADCIGNKLEAEACNRRACPVLRVDGQWSPWESWGVCTRSCGIGGKRIRARSCSNPPPRNGGSNCVGNPIEEESCNSNACPVLRVDGSWSPWQQWSTCTRTCGSGGKRRRSRTCSNPPPKNGGANCVGNTFQEEACNFNIPCPVLKIDGAWSLWQQWSVCSRSCGGGQRFRRRSCDNPIPSHGGLDCIGNRREEETCNTLTCPAPKLDGAWSFWEQWSSCSRSCGGGKRARKRGCTNPPPANGGLPCVGLSAEEESCNKEECEAKSSEWNSWGSWSLCSATCGNFGIRTRRRGCPEKSFCIGQTYQEERCNVKECPIEITDAVWGPWGDWESCIGYCGRNGLQPRTRRCFETATTNCRDTNTQWRNCTKMCPKERIFRYCGDDRFLCQTGDCIDESKVCDGVNDCRDKEDGEEGTDECCGDDETTKIWMWVAFGLACGALVIAIILAIILCCVWTKKVNNTSQVQPDE